MADTDNGDMVIEMDLLPPRWLDIQDEVSDILSKITTQTSTLEKLHQKHVLPGFEDEDVKKREEREIERLTQDITRGFQLCQKAIVRIDGMVKESKNSGGISNAEEKMAKNLKINLATRVGDASTLFRKKQSAYLKSMPYFSSLTLSIILTMPPELRQLGGFSSPLDRSSTPLNIQNPYATPSLLDSEADASFSSATLQQARQRQSQIHEDPAIAIREREIEQIASGILDLSTLFRDLQNIVIDQGSMLDRIDYNVDRMALDVKAADKELTVATGYQKRSVKRKIILLLLLLVVGMFILLGLKIGSRSRSSAPPAANEPLPNPPAPPKLERREDVVALAEDVLKRDWRRRRRRWEFRSLS